MQPDQPRRPGRPATGRTPVRTIRIGDLWSRFEALLAPGETMTDVIKQLLAAEERRRLRRAQRDQAATEPDQ